MGTLNRSGKKVPGTLRKNSIANEGTSPANRSTSSGCQSGDSGPSSLEAENGDLQVGIRVYVDGNMVGVLR